MYEQPRKPAQAYNKSTFLSRTYYSAAQNLQSQTEENIKNYADRHHVSGSKYTILQSFVLI
jgi:hypothetical protein